MSSNLYFDYQATTPVDPSVSKVIYDSLKSDWGNPSSPHEFGIKAKLTIENARKQVGQLINSKATDIIFTSGGTESNNIALFSGLEHWKVQNLKKSNKALPHYIISNVEHPAVAEPVKKMVSDGLVTVSYLSTNKDGTVDTDGISMELMKHPNTIMISVMLVNNETGVINNIKRLVQLVREFEQGRERMGCGRSSGNRIFVHTDAAQAIGKIHVNVVDLDIDYLTIVGHKVYGPRIGALYAKNTGIETPVFPIVFGAGQERGYRPGTENTPMIAGLGKVSIYIIKNLYFFFLGFAFDVYLSGNHANDKEERVVSSLQDPRKLGLLLDLVTKLAENGIFIGRGSACHSGISKPSPVLTAMGVDNDTALTSLRFSVGRETSASDVDIFVSVYYQSQRSVLMDHMLNNSTSLPHASPFANLKK
ncbi:Selenocysteine lyase [Zancudomyces culisetae]|uniref:Selenocysteine lyase n=1 Tax=Zancudomyces culisetae TaxID=1213189 RepID=A0A1R1PJT5_ZANCU|nr:Selenocysteine lyase [Zancudomyces culisetae]|eukprot:OMH81183.1 Selenocysteine lyase [Zancudomyces culisetae]